jgi:hypothetical protein
MAESKTTPRYTLLISLALVAAAIAACSASASDKFYGPCPQHPHQRCGVPIKINSPGTLHGVVGKAYSFRYHATGGMSNGYVFSVKSGNRLPPGISLSRRGVLHGTGTKAGLWRFTVCAKDEMARTKWGMTYVYSTCGFPTSFTVAPPPPVAATNFSGQWHGTYSGSLASPEGCAFQIGGPITFSITQTGTSLSVTIAQTDGYVTYDTSSCAIISRAVNTISFGATVVGLTASGTTNGGSTTKLTMVADLSSFSGSISSACCQSTFTNVVRG